MRSEKPRRRWLGRMADRPSDDHPLSDSTLAPRDESYPREVPADSVGERRWPFDDAGGEDRGRRRLTERDWPETGESVYGIADHDGTLRQVESATWQKSPGGRPQRFVPRTGRNGRVFVRNNQSGARSAESDHGSDSTWVMQVAASCLVILGAFYGLHGHTRLASEVHAVYQRAFADDRWPAVSRELERFAASHHLHWPVLARQVGLSILHAPLNHATLASAYRPDNPEVVLTGSPRQPVLAAGSGIVAKVSQGPGGATIAIHHGSFATTWYVGVQHPNVRAGEYVTAGEVIGRLSSSAHPVLRFGLQRDGRWQDPSSYVALDGSGT